MIDKLTLLALSAIATFVAISPAEAGAYTKARRYPAFSCFAKGKLYSTVADTPEAMNVSGQAISGVDHLLYCPHVSTEDFGLAEVEMASVSVYHYQTTPNQRTKACSSWASYSNGNDSFWYSCGTWTTGTATTSRSETLVLQGSQLDPWHNAANWYAYLIVDMAGAGFTAAVVGYKVSD
jgi:hypothetical protein